MSAYEVESDGPRASQNDLERHLLIILPGHGTRAPAFGRPWWYSLTDESRAKTLSIQERNQGKRIAQPGSVFGSIVNILATIMGTGLLALPYAMAGCGVYVGIALFIIIMMLSIISYVSLSKAVKSYNGACEFKTLAQDSLPMQFSWIVDFCVFINCSGCGVMSLIVMSTLMPEVIKSICPEAQWWLLNRQLWCLTFAGVSFPLVVAKKLEALKYTSLLVVILILFTLGVMIYYAVLEQKEWEDPLVYYSFPGDIARFLKMLSIIANAFTCSQNVPCVVNSLVNPTKWKLILIFTISAGVSLVLYISAAFAGYVTFGDKVDSDILRSYPTGLLPVTFARLSITLALTGSYPVQLHPARESLAILLFDVPAQSLKKCMYLNLTICIWGSTLGIALLTDNLGRATTFIGALAAVPLTFIYPNLFWIKMSSQMVTKQTVWPSWVVLMIGFILVPVSIIGDLYYDAKEK